MSMFSVPHKQRTLSRNPLARSTDVTGVNDDHSLREAGVRRRSVSVLLVCLGLMGAAASFGAATRLEAEFWTMGLAATR